MNVFGVGFELICGVSLGFEYVGSGWLDEEDETTYIIVDLFILRLLITKEKI